MSDVVLKPFNTDIRRLKIGDAVSENDDLSPYSFEALKERGFIGASTATPAASCNSDDE